MTATTKSPISEKLRAVLTAMAEGETLCFQHGKWSLGSEPVNGNVLGSKVFGHNGPALIEKASGYPKGVEFWRLTDAGRDAIREGR